MRAACAAAVRYSHHCLQFRSLANGPFNMIDLPLPGSAFSLGLAEFTNNMRAEGYVYNSEIAAGFSLGYCSSADMSSGSTCSDAESDVPLVWGSFDFATFCQAF